MKFESFVMKLLRPTTCHLVFRRIIVKVKHSCAFFYTVKLTTGLHNLQHSLVWLRYYLDGVGLVWHFRIKLAIKVSPVQLVLLDGVVKINCENVIIIYFLYHKNEGKFFPKITRDKTVVTSIRGL